MDVRRPAAAIDMRGLCADCAHVRSVTTLRGSSFVLCGRSFTDDRFNRYPRLPVLDCSGYDTPSANQASPEAAGTDASATDGRPGGR